MYYTLNTQIYLQFIKLWLDNKLKIKIMKRKKIKLEEDKEENNEESLKMIMKKNLMYSNY